MQYNPFDIISTFLGMVGKYVEIEAPSKGNGCIWLEILDFGKILQFAALKTGGISACILKYKNKNIFCQPCS